MLTHLLEAFRRLFTSTGSRLEVGALILVMAAVPVVEMGVVKLFSDLILAGPERLQTDQPGVVRDSVVFFVALAAVRVVHHGVRVQRVRVFRKRFEQSTATYSPSQESWNWALAFELSSVLANVVQVTAFSALFLVLDPLVGAVNGLVVGLVLLTVSLLYRRQLGLQRDYVRMGSKPGTTAISERVGARIRVAELGALLASVGMAVGLAVVLVRTLTGAVSGSEAIVFFLGLRLCYGQVGTLSQGIMRFARASARSGVGG